MDSIFKYTLGFFLLIITFFSCSSIKKSLSSKNLNYLNRTVDSMYSLDQSIRYASTEIDVKFGVDRKSNGRYLFFREKKEKLGDRYKLYQKAQDSILKVRDSIDFSNTKKLIHLTEKYGFPSLKRLKAKKATAYLIFVHSPKKFHTKIEELISKENEMKRISEYEKEYIFWHLKGRNGAPPRLSEDGTVFYPKMN